MAKLVSKVYGDALFEAARDCGKMDEIFEEVQSIGVILEENAELQKILGNPRVMREDKEQMIETIFRGRVSNEIVELMKLMIEKGRYSKIDSVFEYFIGLVKEEKKIGIARGVYTNEAGLGSSPIVAAAAKTNSGVRQGLLSMTSVFVTTILTCSMTGLVIISSGLMDSSDMNGSTLVTAAYNMCLPHNIGMYLIAVGIMFFAFTTILGWNYYGERCLVYLTGTTKWIKPYKIIYIAAIALAPFLSLEPIWLLADITNALMIIPNLIAIIALRKVIIGETKLYFSKQNEEKMSAAVKAVE